MEDKERNKKENYGEDSKNSNEIKIGDRDIRIYLGQCDFQYQRYDQIILIATDKWFDKMKYICEIKLRTGSVLPREYKGENGQPIFKTVYVDMLDKNTGRIRQVKVSKIELSKHHDFFMFTDADKEPLILDKEDREG